MPNTFTINSIDKEKGHVSVTFSVDGKVQTMGDAPLSSAEELKAFLEKYGAEYERSLAELKVVVPEPKVAELDALVGETFPVSA